MTAAILLTALAILPRSPVVETRCVLVDLNHVVSPETGTETLCQLVYHAEQDGELRIIAWRLLRSRAMIPTRRGRHYEANWLDGDTFRRVRCQTVVETWATEDYEVKARCKWPAEHRRELGR